MFSDEMKKRIEYAFDFDFNWRETAIPLITQEELDQYKLYRPGVYYGILDFDEGRNNANQNQKDTEFNNIDDNNDTDTIIKMKKEREKRKLLQDDKFNKKQELLSQMAKDEEIWIINEIQEYHKVMMPTLVMQYWGYTDPEKYKKEMLEN